MTDADGEDDPAAFEDQLDKLVETLEDAETESDLDAIEADLDAIEQDLENASLPTPEEPEDEDAEAPPDPRDVLEDHVSELRDSIEEQRGPYASDVIDDIASAQSTLTDTEWATEGEDEVTEVIATFYSDTREFTDIDGFDAADHDPTSLSTFLGTISEQIEQSEYDPDVDATTIAALLDGTNALLAGLDDATAFSDLQVREQLNRRGFFDVLGHYKDFPPEWSAIKVHEDERNVEMILLAFDLLDSNFMEEHCIDALRRLGDERAVEPMMKLATRRNKAAIEVLGKIGSEDPIDMFLDYIDTDSDPHLQRVTLKALGEIGSLDATEDVAQQLQAEDDEVRSQAARALGMIGDPRAILPLTESISEDPSANVRGSAAWALVQIGTSEAFSTLSQFADDQEYLVEVEAKKIAELA